MARRNFVSASEQVGNERARVMGAMFIIFALAVVGGVLAVGLYLVAGGAGDWVVVLVFVCAFLFLYVMGWPIAIKVWRMIR